MRSHSLRVCTLVVLSMLSVQHSMAGVLSCGTGDCILLDQDFVVQNLSSPNIFMLDDSIGLPVDWAIRVNPTGTFNQWEIWDADGPSLSIDAGTLYTVDLDANGVGIATIAPATALHIVDSSLTRVPAITIDNGLVAWQIASDSSKFAIGKLFESRFPFSIEELAPDSSLYISANGNVGVGTDNPTAAVDVERSAAASVFQLTSLTNTSNQAAQFVQRRSRGSAAAPAAVRTGDNLGLVSFRGYTGSGFSGTRAAVSSKATQVWSPTGNGASLRFSTTPNGTTSPQLRMEITHNGQIVVNGSQLNVPDYVFEESYPLLSLTELESFIEEKGHLPNLPAAEEIRRSGLSLVEMQMNLLEKVEELSLYAIEQHKQLALQQELVAQLVVENQLLLERFENLD